MRTPSLIGCAATLATLGCWADPGPPTLGGSELASLVDTPGVYTCGIFTDRMRLGADGSLMWTRDHSDGLPETTEIAGHYTVSEITEGVATLTVTGEKATLVRTSAGEESAVEVAPFEGTATLSWVRTLEKKAFVSMYRDKRRRPLVCTSHGEVPPSLYDRGSQAGAWAIQGDLTGFYLPEGTVLPGRKNH